MYLFLSLCKKLYFQGKKSTKNVIIQWTEVQIGNINPRLPPACLGFRLGIPQQGSQPQPAGRNLWKTHCCSSKASVFSPPLPPVYWSFPDSPTSKSLFLQRAEDHFLPCHPVPTAGHLEMLHLYHQWPSPWARKLVSSDVKEHRHMKWWQHPAPAVLCYLDLSSRYSERHQLTTL